MSLEFDDGLTRVSVGRTMPPASASVGYLDGAVFSRIAGGFTFGAGGGFEPAFSQRSLSTDFRKFVLFGSYRSEGSLPVMGSLAYSRIYFHSSMDREVSSASLNIDVSNQLHLWVQTDVDLRMVRNGDLIMRPNVTNLFAMANYRITGFLSIGAGMSAWRPTYSYSSVSMLADSLLDKSLRSSPTASLSLSLPGNVSFFNNYTPRSSNAGWGKEYSNTSSASVSNILNSGAGIRGTMNVNSGATTTTRGYGASIHKTVMDFCDLTVRYQYYRTAIIQTDQLSRSKSFATDLMLSPWKNFALWGSVERFLGLGADATNVIAELSWSF